MILPSLRNSTRIAQIDTIIVELPTRREHKWTGLTEPIGRYMLTRMTDDDGRCRLGRGARAQGLGRRVRPLLRRVARNRRARHRALPGAGRDRRRSRATSSSCIARMDAVIKGYPYAKCAVEFAAYDLAGRRAGVPVHTLLGGHARSRMPVTHSIGLIGIAEAEEEAAQGRGRRHQDHQDQGRRRSQARHRDRAARSATPSDRTSNSASMPTRATGRPAKRSAPCARWRRSASNMSSSR